MGPTQATESSIWHVPRMRNRAKSSALAADTPRRHRAPISDSPSLSIRSRGARKGSKWASERAARVDSGVVMGWDQGADGAGSARGLYQDPLRAQGAWFDRATMVSTVKGCPPGSGVADFFCCRRFPSESAVSPLFRSPSIRFFDHSFRSDGRCSRAP